MAQGEHDIHVDLDVSTENTWVASTLAQIFMLTR